MNETFRVKGSVRKLEQRNQSKQHLMDRLGHHPDRESYDVEFSPSGQVLLETSYTYSGSVYRRTRFEYGEAGRLIRKLSFDGAGADLWSSEHTYTESRCIRVNRDSQGVITSHGVDDYIGNDLMLSTTTFCNWNNLKNWNILKSVKRFEYAGGSLVKSELLDYLLDGTGSGRRLEEYDSEGRIHKTYGLKADGSPLGDGRYKYKYDHQGRCITTWAFNEGDNVATSATIYEYVDDEVGNWTERHEFHLWRDNSCQIKRLTIRTITYYKDIAPSF
jgi:hypothetical protein